MRKIVSVYGSHNAAIAFLLDNEQVKVKVIEIERLLAYKNSGLAQYKAIGNADEMVKFALNIAKRQWNIENNFDLCISSNMDSIHGYPDGTWEKIFYDRTINAKEKVLLDYNFVTYVGNLRVSSTSKSRKHIHRDLILTVTRLIRKLYWKITLLLKKSKIN